MDLFLSRAHKNDSAVFFIAYDMQHIRFYGLHDAMMHSILYKHN